ncbi:MAG TPA: hypothetical protein VMP03_07040, partial [Methylomirabilota bacterium]|nr:hypothetical protein [Methylomirabilota bacterium]
MPARFRPHRAVLALACASLALQPSPAAADDFFGTAGNDVIVGTSGGDFIEGLAGDDLLRGDPAVGDGPIAAVRRVSTGGPDANGDEAEGDESSTFPAFSPDGTKVVFRSYAQSLGSNGLQQAMIKDLATGGIEIVSTTAPDAGGNVEQGDGSVFEAKFSPDGQKILINTDSSNFGIPLFKRKIFEKNLSNGDLVLVSSSEPDVNGETVAANQNSFEASYSADGSRVVFTSIATNLSDDQNGVADVFVKDLVTGAVTMVSLAAPDSNGVEAPSNGNSRFGAFSPDGTKVAFSSAADNLVADDVNGKYDVFVKDLVTGLVTLVSSSSPITGVEIAGDGHSTRPIFSPDGGRVAFLSESTTFGDDANAAADIFVKDLTTREVTLLTTTAPTQTTPSMPTDGVTGENFAFDKTWSGLFFSSTATNLGQDADTVRHLFRKDLNAGTVSLVSTSAPPNLVPAEADVISPSVSADGSMVAFSTPSGNLISGDTNVFSDVFVATLSPGTGGDDVIKGGDGADTLIGGPGDDTLVGDDAIGDDAIDTAVFPGPRHRYDVSTADGVTYTIQDKAAGSPEGTDTLTTVELLKFGSDAPVSVSNPGPNNLPPVVGAIGPLKVKAGAAVGPVEVVATDPEGDPLAVTVLSGG